MSANSSQKLLIRLSSLGDVILATAALEVFRLRGEKVDWLVSREYASLLEGHPGIRRLWIFDRKAGFREWWRLAQELCGQGYIDVYDLHGTLRSLALWVSMRVMGRGLTPSAMRPAWHRCAKPRFRLLGYVFFRKAWPKAWRPARVVRRMAIAVGGSGDERPDLTHLLVPSEIPSRQHRVALMPSSIWSGKCWPAERFVEVMQKLPGRTAVVLGTDADQASHRVAESLKQAGLAVESGVGKWNLAETARALASCEVYVGNDTGLAHLAEAVGTPAWVLFGPTAPDMGFGPWRAESRTLEVDHLACHPCGKDGRRCYRFWEPYACMKRLQAEKVVALFEKADPVRSSSRS